MEEISNNPKMDYLNVNLIGNENANKQDAIDTLKVINTNSEYILKSIAKAFLITNSTPQEIEQFKAKGLNINIYLDITKFRNDYLKMPQSKILNGEIPKWAVAFAQNSDNINMLSLNTQKLAEGHNNDQAEDFVKRIVHEAVHSYHNYLMKDKYNVNSANYQNYWLSEGLSIDAANQYTDGEKPNFTARLAEMQNGSKNYRQYKIMYDFVKANHPTLFPQLFRNFKLLNEVSPKLFKECQNKYVSDNKTMTNAKKMAPFSQRSGAEMAIAKQIRIKNQLISESKKQIQSNELNIKPMTLTQKPSPSTFNNGFVNVFILSLIVSFICGGVAMLTYMLISR